MNKKLYRSQRDYIFAGVAGGLGEYFNVTPWLFRILFFINPGLLIYILMWIFVPLNSKQKIVKKPYGNVPYIILAIVVGAIILTISIGIFSSLFINLIIALSAINR